MTPSDSATDEVVSEKGSLADAIEEVLKLWLESGDAVVTRRTIDAIAEKHKVNQKLLGYAWQNFLKEVIASGSRKRTA